MLGLSERQKKWVAAGVTSVAVTVVCTFVVCICWGLLKVVDLAAPALVPVVLGVLLVGVGALGAVEKARNKKKAASVLPAVDENAVETVEDNNEKDKN